MNPAGDLLDWATEVLRSSAKRLSRTGDEDEQAAELLEHVLGRRPRRREKVTSAQRRRFERLVRRRAAGEPLPQLVGGIDFLGLRLEVRSGAFVPRPSSESLARNAIRRLPRARRPVVVDLATGVGPVALAVAAAARKAEVHGCDLSRAAVRTARANAKRLSLDATFHAGDLFAPLPPRLRGTVDVITIHPPYVPRGEVSTLPDEVRKYEPRSTLTDHSDDGLGLVRRVATEGPPWLRADGWLLVECDKPAARGVARILRSNGWRDVRVVSDAADITRVVAARRPR